VRIGQLGETEIQHLDGAVLTHFDVRRLEVAVHDAAIVRPGERVGQLSRDPERFVEGQRARLQDFVERLPVDELHDDRVRVRPAGA
jgi:hypothetical protein